MFPGGRSNAPPGLFLAPTLLAESSPRAYDPRVLESPWGLRFRPGAKLIRDLLPIVRKALAGRYSVDRELGRGGTSVVYLAQDSAGQDVALKILRPELCATVSADRFLREIRLIARLDHPKVGRLIDSGEQDWLVYYVMPYLEGPTLKQALDLRRFLPPEDALRIGGDLLDALSHAHAHQVVHRDVKPDNIILARPGAVLLDFGIARAVALSGTDRLTRSGVAVGTSSYMSPEQVLGLEEIDPRSDLYSVGCVLYECLAGRPPFHHRNEVVVLRMQQSEPPPDLLRLAPSTPPSMAMVIMKALAKQREERWGSADEMLQALRNA